MNFIDTIEARHVLDTEELLNQLSQRIDLEDNNEIVFSALGMIMLAHSGDNRRQNDSCVNHILRVTLTASDLSENSKKIILLALLHDIVEDYPEYIAGPTDDLWVYLEKVYGKHTTASLNALTNPPAVEEEEKSQNDPVLYHKHLEHTLKDNDAALVKLADFTDNIMTVALSTDKAWKKELNKRYHPAMPLFEKNFEMESYSKDLKKYFEFIKMKN